MCRNHSAIGLALLLLSLAPGSAIPAEADPVAADLKTLEAAKIATDGPTLLEFLRRRTQEVNPDKIKALIRQLGDDSFDVRERASTELVRLGTAAEAYLQSAIQDSDPEVVRRANECLKAIKNGSVAPLAAAVIRMVALHKPAGAAEVLLTYLPFADDDNVADEVRAALGAVALRDGKPDPVLTTALNDKLAVRRAGAAEALCRADAAGELPAIRKLLKDPEPLVQLRVALALTALKEKEAVPVLIQLLGELPPTESWRIEDLLYRISDDKAPPATPGTDPAARRKYRDAWASWWSDHAAGVDLSKLEEKPRALGFTMVVLLDAGRILELDANNKVRWQVDGLQFPLDAQLLPGDRILVAEHAGNLVTERNLKGEILWKKEIEEPLVAQRLPNGNTFIGTRAQLVEVDRTGKTVFTYARPDGELIMKAQKLRNGDIVCISSERKFIRLDAAGKEVQNFPVDVRTYGGRIDVQPGGRILIPLMASNKVVEYDIQGRVIWEAPVEQPIAAMRLPNGNTLVTSMSELRAIEIDRAGRQVWDYKSDTRVTRAWRR